MKIALAQLRIIPGQPSLNFASMQRMISEAKDQGADLVIFPEHCVAGYLLQDRWLDPDWCAYVDSFNEKIKALSKGIGVIWGNIYFHPIQDIIHGRDGRPVRFNAAFFAYNGAYVERENHRYPGLYIKHLNPDYRFFDDSRFFLSGLEIMTHFHQTTSDFFSPFLFNKNNHTYRIGMEVCEDLWSEDYSLDVSQEIINQGIDVLINISSSPWTLNKEKARQKHLAKKASVPLIYVNAVSLQNIGKSVLTFDGDSSFYQNYQRVSECNDRFQEELLIIDLEHPHKVERTFSRSKMLDALLFAIKEFDQEIFKGQVKWIIGLSGGIDSALNGALLAMALGKERILAFNLPSVYNSQLTKDNAHQIAKALDIHLEDHAITGLITETEKILSDSKSDIALSTKENVHARLRGHVLSSLAQHHQGVICNNGNKLEIALGYCTLYGDTIGALAPIGDLIKLQIADLCREINGIYQKEVIPYNLIPTMNGLIPTFALPPTAELKEDQIDPMKWGYHDYLINRLMTYPTRQLSSFIQEYQDKTLPLEVQQVMTYYHLDNQETFYADLKWFMKSLELGIFKRIQMPPIVVISRGAFGYDYRESQLRFEDFDVASLKKE